MSKVYKPSATLPVFFATEMWERYGFYAVQSLLALLLVLHFHFDDRHTDELVGSFIALTYVSPVIGGWLADHYLGKRRAIFIGIILLFLSYTILTFTETHHQLMLGLAMVSNGTGLLKANISALLGDQYKKNDHKRSSGFTIFYLGITTGIILGTILPSKLHEMFGWHASFFSAVIGLMLAFFVFYIGVRVIKIKEHTKLKHNKLSNYLIAGVILSITYSLFYLVLLNGKVAILFNLIVAVGAMLMVLRIAMRETGDQRRKTLALLILFIISILFWSFYFQIFTELSLFITRLVQPTVLGLHFPFPYYVSVESFGMLIIGLFLIRLWPRLKPKNRAHFISIQFTLAMFFMLLAYAIILCAAQYHSAMTLITAWPILVAFLVISLAELLLSPIGLSAVTRLAHENVASTLMGVFLVTLGLGGFLSGRLAKLTAIDNMQANIVQIKNQYIHGFQTLFIILLAALLLSIALTFFIKRLTRHINWDD